MRIEGPKRVHAINPYQQQNAKAEDAKIKSKERDQLQISSEALELQKTQESEAERAERIARLKEEVQSGSYQIDANKIANAIVEKGFI